LNPGRLVQFWHVNGITRNRKVLPSALHPTPHHADNTPSRILCVVSGYETHCAATLLERNVAPCVTRLIGRWRPSGSLDLQLDERKVVLEFGTRPLPWKHAIPQHCRFMQIELRFQVPNFCRSSAWEC
jgi:hypothetical protein